MIEEFQNTDIGYIPAAWKSGRIDDFFTIQQGKSVSKANRIGNNQKPFLRTSNLLWGKVILNKLDYLHFTTEEEIKFKLEYNDLLVCEGGDIGRTAIWKNEMEDIYYQNHLHRVRAKVADIDPVFVLNWMQYALLFGRVYFGRANITTIPNLSKSRLAEFTIPKPPSPEQRKIAYVLSAIQKAIEQQYKLIKTTAELKKALMQKLFTEGISPDHDSPDMPDKHDLKKSSNQDNPMNQGSRIINETEENITHEGLNNSSAKIFNVGTLLIAVYGQGITRGKVGILGIEAATNQACAAIIPNDEKTLNTKYLYHFLAYSYNDLRSMGHGANQKNLSSSIIKQFFIPIPNNKEQIEITNSLTILDNKIEFHRKKKQTLTDLFKTMLQELMTGQRRVNEIDFEDNKEQLLMAAEPEVEYKKSLEP